MLGGGEGISSFRGSHGEARHRRFGSRHGEPVVRGITGRRIRLVVDWAGDSCSAEQSDCPLENGYARPVEEYMSLCSVI